MIHGSYTQIFEKLFYSRDNHGMKMSSLDIASMIFWTFGCFLDSGLWIGWSSNDHDLALSDNKDPSQNTSFRPTYIVLSLQKVEILVIFRVPRLMTKNISDLISNPFWISKIFCFLDTDITDSLDSDHLFLKLPIYRYRRDHTSPRQGKFWSFGVEIHEIH